MSSDNKPNPSVIRPIPGRCNLHGKVLDVPVKPENYTSHIWICIVCVVNGFWNDDITGKIQKSWPTEFRQGPLALQHFKKEQGDKVRRKGATGA